MTRQNLEIQNLMLEYRDKYGMARAILEYRAVVLFLMLVACGGWAVAIWKCLS